MPTQIFVNLHGHTSHDTDGHSAEPALEVAAGQWHHNPPWDQGPPNSLKLRA